MRSRSAARIPAEVAFGQVEGGDADVRVEMIGERVGPQQHLGALAGGAAAHELPEGAGGEAGDVTVGGEATTP